MGRSYVLQTEILGGLINAALISYAVILNPVIVQATGMAFAALMTTTILVTIIFTFFVGIYARVPFVRSVLWEKMHFLHLQ